MGVLRTKSIEQSIRDTEESEHKLKKDLSAWDLTVFGIGVIVLRRTRPDLSRAFRTPAVALIPILAVIACVFLMLNLGSLTWWRLLVWMALGLVVNFLYGYRNSRLATQRERPAGRR